MNKSKLLKILSFTIPLLVAGVALMPGVAEAEGIIERVALSGINNVLAGFGSFFLGLSSYLVTISGTFLSVSINITTHLKDIYENVTAIQSVWRTIRDISSIFIIFSLLYFSIKTILGVGSSGFNSLIVKIFLAGVLINFSLCFFKLAIDASNIISLQFYRAIAPNTEQNWTVKQSFTDGGLSNVFMQSLKIPTIYQNNGILKSADVSLAIAFATYAGIIMMVVASLSFLAAAIAFTARTAILLFCLAMSPIYFVGLIFPEIKSKVSDKIMGLLYGQVVFMPVYLFLLYIALRIISDPSFNKIFNSNLAGASDPGGIGAISIGVIIQYTIAIFFINLPLVAAIDLGGKGMKWAPDAGKIGRFMTGGFGKSLGRNTYGAAASRVAETNFMKTAASKNFLAAGALKGIRGVAKEYNEAEQKKAEGRAKFGESLGHNKSYVNFHDNRIADLKNEIDEQNLIINSPDSDVGAISAAKTYKKRLETDVKMHERKIAEEKRRRQITYASRLDPRDIDAETGKLKPMSAWQRLKKGKGYVDQNEKLGSAQIHIKNTEAEIEQIKKELEDKKKEQDTHKADIKRIDQREKTNTGITPDEAAERTKIKGDLTKLLQEEINPRQQAIRDKELEVKRYKNLT